MFKRILVPMLLLLAALSTGCRLGIGGSNMADRGDASQYAPQRTSKLIKEAAAEEMQQSQQRPQTYPAKGTQNVQQAVPNRAMSY